MNEDTPEEKAVRSAVTSGAPIRLAKAKTKTRRKTKPIIIVGTESVADGFVDFLRRNGVVALSVGFVIATQVQVLSKQLISSFIDPLFGLFFGATLSERSFTVTVHGHTEKFSMGAFVYSLINFLFIVLMLYIIIKVFKLDKLDIPKEEDEKK